MGPGRGLALLHGHRRLRLISPFDEGQPGLALRKFSINYYFLLITIFRLWLKNLNYIITVKVVFNRFLSFTFTCPVYPSRCRALILCIFLTDFLNRLN